MNSDPGTTMSTIQTIQPEELLARVEDMHRRDLRLMQISCTKTDGFEILYSFDNDYTLENLRLHIEKDTEIESIGAIYAYAFLYENEMKDLFGIAFRNLSVDFDGTLYKTSIKTPFAE